jgi:hypothetical protein
MSPDGHTLLAHSHQIKAGLAGLIRADLSRAAPVPHEPQLKKSVSMNAPALIPWKSGEHPE